MYENIRNSCNHCGLCKKDFYNNTFSCAKGTFKNMSMNDNRIYEIHPNCPFCKVSNVDAFVYELSSHNETHDQQCINDVLSLTGLKLIKEEEEFVNKTSILEYSEYVSSRFPNYSNLTINEIKARSNSSSTSGLEADIEKVNAVLTNIKYLETKYFINGDSYKDSLDKLLTELSFKIEVNKNNKEAKSEK